MSSSVPRRLATAVAAALALPVIAHAADANPPPQPADPGAALDAALAETAPTPAAAPHSAASAPIMQIGGGSGPTLKLADLSLDINTAAGGSTATDAQLATLQGGDHDPKRRGYTLQQAEISLFGAVDPYFNAEAHIVFKEDSVELEEAYGTTTQLPFSLQLKAGYYLTEFGRTNPQHPHQWPWLDQPVVNTRLFGPDGNRGVGSRLSWLAPLPWFSEVLAGMQNPDDPTETSFTGIDSSAGTTPTTIGGRPAFAHPTRSLADFLYATRWVNNWELPENVMLQLGASAAFGPNNTGPNGRTAIVGGDLLLKWREDRFGIPNLAWQTEVIARRYKADDAIDPVSAAAIPEAILRDWGLCSQVLVGFMPRWAAGLRGDYATGDGDSYVLGSGFVDRQTDPFRDDRWRVSPLITFNATEFSKFRLQYDYDHAEHLPSHRAQSVWLGLELMIGAHPAHNY
jgi:hypothetical protein